VARQYSVAATYYNLPSNFTQRRCANSRSAPTTPAILPALTSYRSVALRSCSLPGHGTATYTGVR